MARSLVLQRRPNTFAQTILSLSFFACDKAADHTFRFARHPSSWPIDGVFTPVLAKHSKSFSLSDSISVGVDRMQRNFEPMRKHVEVWQRSGLTDVTAKVVIYEAFLEGKLEAPKHLARTVHDLYFLCGAKIYVALATGRA
jgi:hypothetical protein